MATATIDEKKLKNILKTAIVEAIEEHRDLVQGIVEDAIGDIALARAVEDGLKSESVSRDSVFAILEGKR